MENLGKINLNLLVSLHHLLAERSVTAAAKRQHITQSAMSKNLAKLRELFGNPLLVKINGQLEPTQRALELDAKVARLISDLETLLSVEEFDPALCRRVFTIAATDYVTEYVLPTPLSIIYQQAPHIGINLINWDDTTYENLKTGQVDLGASILDPNIADIHSAHISTDNYVCILRQGHPLSGQEALRLDDLGAYHHAVITTGGDKAQAVDKALASVGIRRKIRLRVPSYPSALNMVATTDLLLTLPAHIAARLSQHHPVVIKALPIDLPEFECSIQWHHRNQQDPAHQWFRKTLYKLMKQEEGLSH